MATQRHTARTMDEPGTLHASRDFEAGLDAASILVHSHLRWDFVWQRPQQLLSRFAESRRVLFVEEPVLLDDSSQPSLGISIPQENIYRIVPRLPASLRELPDECDLVVRGLLRDLIGAGGELAGMFAHPVQWFYTPMPAPTMVGAFDESAIVYDCMDELSKFRFAPAQLVPRERFLLARADVVFTGGRGLYEAKSRHHANVHFYGCGVDDAHYAKARDEATPVASDIANLPSPVLGYVGVIDERLDYELIRSLARSWPEASIVMVGPVVKVDRAELPDEPNIHWLGQRSYDALPSYMKGFDVCLMPFALNHATEFINPTKTLEYMSAGRPVVSTPVPDVVRNFGSLVTIASTHAEFLEGTRAAFAGVDAARVQRAIERASRSSWECIVSEMSQRIDSAIARSPRVPRSPRATTASSGALREAAVRRSP